MELQNQDETVDCGCGPSPEEQRTVWRRRADGLLTRRSALGFGVAGFAALAAGLGGPLLPGAFAEPGYPSWDDVQAAKNNEAAKGGEITRIQGLIQSLNADVARTQAESEAAGSLYYDAQQAYLVANERADQLQAQADTEASKANDASQKAGRVAAQLYRKGGDDTSLELFFSGSAATADDLLSRLGTMDKLIERNQDVYAEAVSARDAAQSLGDQAVVARDERDRLQREAEQKFIAAQNAALAAEAARDAQEANLDTLQAQLAALQDTTTQVVAGYQAGLEAERQRKAREEAARIAAAAERARVEKEAADRRAADAARQAQAAQNSGGGGGGGASASTGGGGGGGGASSGSGWTRPSTGARTSGYGSRPSQCNSNGCASSFHAGVDLAAGCGSGIYAAAAGRVTYAGSNGGYGNYIRIDHGGGIGTGYGHIRDGGIAVRNGQTVSAGQWIAAEGNTGNSFGCHLHFECYVNGSTVNPIGVMSDRGVGV